MTITYLTPNPALHEERHRTEPDSSEQSRPSDQVSGRRPSAGHARRTLAQAGAFLWNTTPLPPA